MPILICTYELKNIAPILFPQLDVLSSIIYPLYILLKILVSCLLVGDNTLNLIFSVTTCNSRLWVPLLGPTR